MCLFPPKPSCGVVALLGLNKGSAHPLPPPLLLQKQRTAQIFGEKLCYISYFQRQKSTKRVLLYKILPTFKWDNMFISRQSQHLLLLLVVFLMDMVVMVMDTLVICVLKIKQLLSMCFNTTLKMLNKQMKKDHIGYRIQDTMGIMDRVDMAMVCTTMARGALR